MNRPTPELEQRFSDWQRGLTLIDKRNQSEQHVADRQNELIEAVTGGSTLFAAYLRTQLGIDIDAHLDGPQLPRKLDPSEFRNPPFELERDLFETWSNDLSAREASQPLLWTRCHLQWIEQGQFGERLDEAFLGTLSSGTAEKQTEAAARNLLRRMGGLPHVRGKISVLSDCPLSRAWWRGKMAEVVSQSSEGTLDSGTIHGVLHSNNDAWARLVGDSVHRITVANHPRLRAALFSQYSSADRAGNAVHAREMQLAMQILARRGPALMFDALEWSELIGFAADAVAQAKEELSPSTAPADGPTD